MPRDEIPEPRDPVVDLITEINAEFMVVTEGGRVVIYKPERDPMLKRDHFVRLDFADFKKWFMNRQVCVGTNTKKQLIMIPIAKVWLEHPDRRQYARVIFDPSGRHAGKNDLNLWRGFAVNPKQGSWAKMQEHIREIICDGNEDHFNWLMGWLARLVQFPGEQGHVAVVLKGMEGSGKGILARGLMRILGQHALTASNPKHLTGQFNGHLRDCIFLFADEAFFAGDRAHVGVLKAFITEDCIMIEPKFKAAGLAPNLLHIMMASNEEWVIPAGLEARRFFVLLVPPGKVGDRAYFDAIQSELDDGGYEAMLYDLSTYDLTGFNHRNPPATEGLQEQKKLSLGTSEAWWMDVLHRGYVFESEHGLEDHFGEWHPEVTTLSCTPATKPSPANGTSADR
jgi:hypothetical protein